MITPYEVGQILVNTIKTKTKVPFSPNVPKVI